MTVALETLSIAVITDLYNLVAEKPVKKFENKAKGVARLTAVLAEKGEEVFNAGTDQDPVYDVRPIPAPVDPHAASNKLIGDAIAKDPSILAPKKGKKEKAPKGTRRGPAPDFGDEQKIEVLVANPKRAGTAAHTRFELYKSGMTVAAFLKAGGTRSDLAWDSKRKHIAIK